MENKMKVFLSIICMAIFIVFAMASEFLDESTNTSVVVEDCEVKPEFTGTLHIGVQYLDSDNEGVSDARCEINIVHQLIDNTDCTAHEVSNETKHFFTDNFGRCEFTTETFLHDNSSDLFRVQVQITPDKDDEDYIPFYQAVQVATYSTTDLAFFKIAPPPLK